MADQELLQRIFSLAEMADADHDSIPVFCDAILEQEFSVGSRAKVAQMILGGAPDQGSSVRVMADDFAMLARIHDKRLPRAVMTVIALGWRDRFSAQPTEAAQVNHDS